MVKIYDCFPFFNELDLLEIRLSELNNFVDYFVLVEARQNHQGKPKPLYFKENKERFKKWNDKIIHIIIDLPKFNFIDKFMIKMENTKFKYTIRKINGMGFFGMGFGGLKMDHWQRKHIAKGLKNCEEDDIIIVSDLDDIPRSEKIKESVKLLAKHGVITMGADFYNYYVNGRTYSSDGNPVKLAQIRVLKFHTLKKRFFSNLHWVRSPFDSPLGRLGIIPRESFLLKDAGWGFSHVGGADMVDTLMNACGHAGEFKTKRYANKKDLLKKMDAGIFVGSNCRIKYVKLDDTFPKSILENQKKFSHLIKRNYTL